MGNHAVTARQPSVVTVPPSEVIVNESTASGRDPLPGRRNRRLSPEQRLEDIVRVASALISDRGYYGTSLQAVAEGCQMTVAGLLHHVKSKDGLLVAVLAHRDRADRAAVETHLGEAHRADPRAFLDSVVRRNASQPEIVRLYSVLASESLDPGHPAHDYFDERYRRSLDGIARHLEGHVEHPRTVSAQVLAVMDGLQLQWLRFPQEVDLFELWTAAADRLLGTGPAGS